MGARRRWIAASPCRRVAASPCRRVPCRRAPSPLAPSPARPLARSPPRPLAPSPARPLVTSTSFVDVGEPRSPDVCFEGNLLASARKWGKNRRDTHCFFDGPGPCGTGVQKLAGVCAPGSGYLILNDLTVPAKPARMPCFIQSPNASKHGLKKLDAGSSVRR